MFGSSNESGRFTFNQSRLHSKEREVDEICNSYRIVEAGATCSRIIVIKERPLLATSDVSVLLVSPSGGS